MNVQKEGEGCLTLLTIVSVVLVALMFILTGCASMPGPMPALPAVQGFAAQPNCVWFCHVIVTIAKAESDVKSDGTAPITTGSQTIDLDSTLSSQKQTSVDPIP